MKLTNLFYGLVLAGLFAVTFTSCGDDINLPENNTPPALSLLDSGTDVISTDATVDANTTVKVNLKATKGTGELKLLNFFENGELIDIDRIVDGIGSYTVSFANSPEDKLGFEKEISFKAQEEGVSDYMFLVEDVNGLKDSVTITLTVVAKTALNYSIDSLVVYNADAPGGYYGSIDLHKGETVSSGSSEGDVQDLGLSSNGWAKKIKPENGAEMVIPSADFDYDALDSFEDLTAAYNNGTVSTETDVVVNGTYMFKITSETTGEFDYFVLKTLDIVETANDNKDYYVFSLKGYKF